jgi:polysaccharide export outer membrane protein
MWRLHRESVPRGAAVFGVVMMILGVGLAADAQQGSPAPPAEARPSLPPAPAGVGPPAALTTALPAPPEDYKIGPDDLLQIVFWKDKDMTTDVVVRPDGRISLPVINEVQAAGLTPDQLREGILAAATKFFEDPSVNVVVKQINSRKVFITGEISKPSAYALTSRMTVIQLIALAGGLSPYAKANDIAIIRTENGQTQRFPVKYKDIMEGKPASFKQNIELKIGDTVHVP